MKDSLSRALQQIDLSVGEKEYCEHFLSIACRQTGYRSGAVILPSEGKYILFAGHSLPSGYGANLERGIIPKPSRDKPLTGQICIPLLNRNEPFAYLVLSEGEKLPPGTLSDAASVLKAFLSRSLLKEADIPSEMNEDNSRRRSIESTLYEIMTAFMILPDEDSTTLLDYAMKKLCLHLGASMSQLFYFSADRKTIHILHEWRANRLQKKTEDLTEIPCDLIPWAGGIIHRFSPVRIPDVSELPADADSEKQILTGLGILSFLAVPVVNAGEVRGFIAIHSSEHKIDWHDEDIRLVRMIGEKLGCEYDRIRAEKMFQSSEERYRQLFQLESDAIFLIDNATGKILDVNASASSTYGYSRDEMMQMKNIDLSAEPDQTIYAAKNHIPHLDINYHRKKDGTVFPVEMTSRHFLWEGKEVYLEAIRAITSRQS